MGVMKQPNYMSLSNGRKHDYLVTGQQAIHSCDHSCNQNGQLALRMGLVPIVDASILGVWFPLRLCRNVEGPVAASTSSQMVLSCMMFAGHSHACCSSATGAATTGTAAASAAAAVAAAADHTREVRLNLPDDEPLFEEFWVVFREHFMVYHSQRLFRLWDWCPIFLVSGSDCACAAMLMNAQPDGALSHDDLCPCCSVFKGCLKRVL